MLSTNFAQSTFRRGMFCIFLTQPEALRLDKVEKRYYAEHALDGYGDLFFYLMIDWDSEPEVHVHLEVESGREPKAGFEEVSFEEFCEKLIPFHGAGGSVRTAISMEVARSSLPEFGFVNSVIDLDAGADDTYLRLNGASFEVSGEQEIRNLRWEALGDESLLVTARGFVETAVSDDYLDECAEFAFTALAKYIFEDFNPNDKIDRNNVQDERSA